MGKRLWPQCQEKITVTQLDWNFVPNAVVADAPAESVEDSVWFEEIEKVTKAHTNATEAPEEWGPGFMTTYWCDIFNRDDELIGTSVGTMIILSKDPETGNMIEYISEQFQLKDGCFAAAGYVDRSDVFAQNWAGYPCVGLSGRYAGMTGYRKWKIMELSGQYPLISEIEMSR
jgi:Allene oxide cyclase barrel like domain